MSASEKAEGAPAGMGGRELSVPRLAAYGFTVVPLAVAGLPIALYIPYFYSSHTGLSLTVIGTMLMLARITDVFTDPLIGHLSDRTHTRWGRRRPWLLAGAPVLMGAAYMLYVPPHGAGAWYLLAAVALIYLGYTFITIPYGAWGAELSEDYHGRNRITTSREVFLIIGVLAGSIVPLLAREEGRPVTPEAMAIFAGATMVILPIAIVALFWSVPEPPPRQQQPQSWRKGLKVVWANGPFKLLLAAGIFGAMGGAASSSVAILFFTHVLELPEIAPVLIIVGLVATGLGAPLWYALSRKYAKHKVLIASVVWSIAILIWVPFLGPGDMWPMIAIAFFNNLSGAAVPILGASMAADVVDLDMVKSRRQRTAFFFSFWGMGNKAASALGVGLALPLVELAGFDPAGGNGPSELFALTAAYFFIPITLGIISISLLVFYPIDHKMQARIRRLIDRRVEREARRAADEAVLSTV